MEINYIKYFYIRVLAYLQYYNLIISSLYANYWINNWINNLIHSIYSSLFYYVMNAKALSIMRYQDDINTEHNMKSICRTTVAQWTTRLTRNG